MSASFAGAATGPDPRAARVLVVGDAVDAVDAARLALAADFPSLVTTVGAPQAQAAIVEARPAVLVLAFHTLEQAETLVAGLGGAAAAPRRVALCHVGEVAEALQACQAGRLDDYVPFWPQPPDRSRLVMAVWTATRLGVAPPPAAADDETEPFAAPPVGKPARPIVLAVEDDPFAAKLLVSALRAEGVDVIVAGDADEAKAHLRRVHPQAILMDVNLPGTDGLSFTEYLKASPALSHIPVIMATGEATRHVIERSIAIGAAGFVVKPFSREQLMAKLSRYLV